jgi:predicted nuclease of predicted toxin-antitoxin system
MTPRPAMVLIIDENVPVQVADFFRERGHLVIQVRDFLDVGVSDESIASRADELMAVVVTWDRDFKRLVGRVPIGERLRFRRLGRISFDCRPERGRRRAEQLIDYIEFAYEVESRRRDRRLIVEITETSFRVVR